MNERVNKLYNAYLKNENSSQTHLPTTFMSGERVHTTTATGSNTPALNFNREPLALTKATTLL